MTNSLKYYSNLYIYAVHKPPHDAVYTIHAYVCYCNEITITYVSMICTSVCYSGNFTKKRLMTFNIVPQHTTYQYRNYHENNGTVCNYEKRDTIYTFIYVHSIIWCLKTFETTLL